MSPHKVPLMQGNTPNWIGVLTVYHREVWRFSKVWNQTLISPIISTLLFLAVLTLAMGENKRTVGDLPFDVFVAPGLVMMAVVQNAFANSSSSLMLAKIQGVIIDILMPPLKGWEITLGIVAGGITRGLAVGVGVMLAMYVFVPFTIYYPFIGFYYVVMASMMLALLGMLGGIYAQGFDQLSAFTNYLVTPLSFLSGTFYSIQQLPPFWQNISYYNPFFYMIDGFRFALTGHSDGDIFVGMILLAVVNIVLSWIVQRLFSQGWRLRS